MTTRFQLSSRPLLFAVRESRVQEPFEAPCVLPLCIGPFEQEFAEVPERSTLPRGGFFQCVPELLAHTKRKWGLPLAHVSASLTEVRLKDHVLSRTSVGELDTLRLDPGRELHGEVRAVHKSDSDVKPSVFEMVIDPVHALAPNVLVSPAEPVEPALDSLLSYGH